MSNGGVIGKNNKPTSSSAPGVWGLSDLYHSRLTSDWPGSPLEVHVGSFQQRAGAGIQAVTFGGDKEWVPKAIIFFTSGSDAVSGTWSADILQAVGFTAGSSNSYAAGGLSLDNHGGGATSEASRSMAAAAITIPNTAGSGVFEQASLSSFDVGGFTLNWTTVTNAAGQIYIGYIALGGDIQAYVKNWTCFGSPGGNAITGVPFQPDIVFHAFTDQAALGSATHMRLGFGAMNAAGEQWAVAISADDALSSSNTARWQRTDSTLLGVTTGGGQRYRASFTSMNADGFSLNFATDSGAVQFASLCIKGVKSKLASHTQFGSTGSRSITGIGFQPALAGVLTQSAAASTSPGANAGLSFGAYDGMNQRVVAQNDQDGVSPTAADSIWRNDKVLLMNGNGPTTVSSMDVTGFTADGWTENWTSDGTGRQYVSFALAGKD